MAYTMAGWGIAPSPTYNTGNAKPRVRAIPRFSTSLPSHFGKWGTNVTGSNAAGNVFTPKWNAHTLATSKTPVTDIIAELGDEAGKGFKDWLKTGAGKRWKTRMDVARQSGGKHVAHVLSELPTDFGGKGPGLLDKAKGAVKGGADVATKLASNVADDIAFVARTPMTSKLTQGLATGADIGAGFLAEWGRPELAGGQVLRGAENRVYSHNHAKRAAANDKRDTAIAASLAQLENEYPHITQIWESAQQWNDDVPPNYSGPADFERFVTDLTGQPYTSQALEKAEHELAQTGPVAVSPLTLPGSPLHVPQKQPEGFKYSATPQGKSLWESSGMLAGLDTATTSHTGKHPVVPMQQAQATGTTPSTKEPTEDMVNPPAPPQIPSITPYQSTIGNPLSLGTTGGVNMMQWQQPSTAPAIPQPQQPSTATPQQPAQQGWWGGLFDKAGALASHITPDFIEEPVVGAANWLGDQFDKGGLFTKEEMFGQNGWFTPAMQLGGAAMNWNMGNKALDLQAQQMNQAQANWNRQYNDQKAAYDAQVTDIQRQRHSDGTTNYA